VEPTLLIRSQETCPVQITGFACAQNNERGVSFALDEGEFSPVHRIRIPNIGRSRLKNDDWFYFA